MTPHLTLLLALSLVAGLASLESAAAQEPDEREITVGTQTFHAWAAGPADGDLVLLLHGFPQTGYSWRHQLVALGEAGYLAVAPDQRGYSPGARPTEVEAYAMNALVGDVVGIVGALERSEFHLVGHDWGGAVAWVVASVMPERVKSVTVLSTPHVSAFSRSLADPESEQSRRSSYFEVFAAEGAEDRFLADDGAFFRGLFAGAVDAEDVDVYWDVLGSPAAMRAALNWYTAQVRGASVAAAPSAEPLRTPVPTLYIWGENDSAFDAATARATAEFVDGPYAGHEVEGAGHWLPEERADFVTRKLLEHVSAH